MSKKMCDKCNKPKYQAGGKYLVAGLVRRWLCKECKDGLDQCKDKGQQLRHPT